MYQNFEAIIEAVKQQPTKKTICIANAASDKMLHLAHELQAQDICNMILVGDEAQIKAFAEKENVDLSKVKVIQATETEEIARLAVTEVSAGRADVYVKGSMNTSDFLRSVLNKEVGLRTGSKLSVLTCYEVPGQKKLFFLTDGGMVVAPDLNDKAAIVTNAVNVLHNMGIAEPKVAILSSNEKVSEKIPSTVDARRCAGWQTWESSPRQFTKAPSPLTWQCARTRRRKRRSKAASPETWICSWFRILKQATALVRPSAILAAAIRQDLSSARENPSSCRPEPRRFAESWRRSRGRCSRATKIEGGM